MVPLYGGAELAQAFCRVAAVAGATYILKCPLVSLLPQDTGSRQNGAVPQGPLGVRLSSGQVPPSSFRSSQATGMRLTREKRAIEGAKG